METCRRSVIKLYPQRRGSKNAYSTEATTAALLILMDLMQNLAAAVERVAELVEVGDGDQHLKAVTMQPFGLSCGDSHPTMDRAIQ